MIQRIQDAVASTLANYESIPREAANTTAQTAAEVPEQMGSSALPPTQEMQKNDKNQDKQDDQSKLTKQDASNITDALNELMDKMNCDLEFKYYDKLDQLTVKMVDKKTKETIKEFPPEEIIKAMIKTKDWIGTFLDKLA